MSNPRLGSKSEIENDWTICDLFDAHEILDTMEYIREVEEKKSNTKK